MRKTFLVISLLATLFLGAQDIHFSQFYASPLTLNPAMTGFLNGDCRAGVMYRNQWKSVTVPFVTISGAYEHKFTLENGDQFGAGLVVVSDKSGDANFNITKIHLSGAYHKKLSENQQIALGFQPGYVQKSIDVTNLTFPNQYDNSTGLFDPNNPSGEPLGNMDFNVSYIDVNMGALWSGRFGDNLSAYAGVGAFHLNMPQESFYSGGDSRLPMRLVVHGGARIITGENISVVPDFIYMTQGGVTELNIGGAVEYSLPDNENPATLLSLGGYYRNKDALIVTGGVGYKNMKLGLCYDFNTSDLSVASANKGGFELSFTYICFLNKLPTIMAIPCRAF